MGDIISVSGRLDDDILVENEKLKQIIVDKDTYIGVLEDKLARIRNVIDSVDVSI